LLALDSTEHGVDFTASIDSFSTTTQGLISSTQPAQLPAQITGSLDSSGITISNEPTGEKCNPVTSVLVTDLHNLLVPFPTPLSAGTAWNDSVDVSGCQSGVPLSVHISRSYLVSGEVLHEGQAVVLVSRADTASASGEGGLQQHRVTIKANGTGTALYYLNPVTGRVVRITIDQVLNFRVSASGKLYEFKQSSKQDFRTDP
jgi:hypothetical protein